MSRKSYFARNTPCLSMIVACVIVLATVAFSARARAADETKPKPSLDDALLNDLDNELLEGAGGPKKPTDPSKVSPKGGSDEKKREPKGDKPAGDTAETDGEDVGMPAEDADPLTHVSQEMRLAGEAIPKSAKRTYAEQVQQRIVEDLDRLITQAEQQKAQQSSSSKSKKQQSKSQRQTVQQPKKEATGNSGKDSNKPAQDSTDRLGKAEAARPDPEALKGFMKDAWGHLPAHDREQMLQTTREQFLPQYELMIEKYYKRLAEDQRSK